MKKNMYSRQISKRLISFVVFSSMILACMMQTFTGLAAGSLPNTGKIIIEAEDFDSMVGGKIQTDNPQASGGKYIGDFYVNHSLSYLLTVETAGNYQISMRIGTPNSGGSVKVSTNGREATVNGFKSTGGWQNYQEIMAELWLDAGEQTLTITNLNQTWNIDKLEIQYLDDLLIIQAEDFDSKEGAVIQTDNPGASGGLYIGDFYEGNRLFYKLDVPEAGYYQVNLRIGSPNGGSAKISSNGRTTAANNFGSTQGWQDYQDVLVYLWLDAGEQTFTVENTGQTWNFDKMEFLLLTTDPAGLNLASWAKPAASSGDAVKAVDGEENTQWIADGIDGEYITLRFEDSFYFDRIVLLDAENSHITSGTLFFSDNSSVSVGELSVEGTEITFAKKQVHWVMFRIDSVSDDTEQVGLRNFEVYGDFDYENTKMDMALQSYVRTNGRWEDMNDTLSSVTVQGNTLEMLWTSAVSIDAIYWAGFPADSAGEILSGTATYSDGSGSNFSGIITDNGVFGFALSSESSESLTVKIDSWNEDSVNTIPIVQVVGNYSEPEPEPENYIDTHIINYWQSQWLVEEDDGISYTSDNSNINHPTAKWDIVKVDENIYTIQNRTTGNYIKLPADSSEVACLPDGNQSDAGLWEMRVNSGSYNLYNVQYPARALHLENQTGKVQAGSIQNGWYSARWNYSSMTAWEDHYYAITSNTIEGTAGKAVAYNDRTIISNIAGKGTKSWNLTQDISGMPKFTSGNTMADAVYNLSLEEIVLNTKDGKYGKVFWTGTNWSKVWTRDTAMAIQYSLGWMFPEESENCIREKVIQETNVFEQDTGTGGSYPVSVDKIIMEIATWEQYLASGDTQLLEDMYQVAVNNIEQDDHVVLEEKSGLYRGETGGFDHRSETYPDWMDEVYDNSLVNIAESKSSIVNIIYVEVMNILSQSAEILGKGEETVQYWKERSESLKKAVNDNFWLEDRGMYASWIYPDYMGSPVADKVDVISNGYALLFGIADDERAASILENYPMVTYGANNVWPQKNGRLGYYIYHNQGVWPGWEPALMLGAKERGNMQMAEEIWKSCIRAAGASCTNKEVVDFRTGEGLASDRQLWSIAGTLSGYYRILFGMDYELDGIHFSPYVPEWLDGPFELTGYTYRDSELTLKLTGQGDTLVSIKVDGEEKPLDYVFPADSTGSHTIEMVVSDSGHRDTLNVDPINWIICPPLPELQYNEDTNMLHWTPDAQYTYKLWNGSEYIDVTGLSSYPAVDGKYGVYSLVSVASNGVTSEMSKPVIVNSEVNVFYMEAEDLDYNPSNFGNTLSGYTGTGYVVDNMNNRTDISMTVTIPQGKAGEYLLHSIYHNEGNAIETTYCAIRSVYVDGEDAGTMIFPLSYFIFDRGSYVSLYLSEGEHTITITYDESNWYDKNMNITRNNVSYDSFRLEFRGDSAAPAELNTRLLEYAISYADRVEASELDSLIPSVKAKFIEALAHAKEVYAGATATPPTVTQDDVDEATEALIQVIHYLEFKQADKTELLKLIATAEQYESNQGAYTPATYGIFAAALEDAREVANDEELMDNDAVQEAWDNLMNAILDLRLIPNKDILAGLLKRANAENLSLYTVKSGTVLRAAADKAADILADENAVEEEVLEAEDGLKKAFKELEPLAAKGSGTDKTAGDESSASKDSSVKQSVSAGTGNPKTGEQSNPAGMIALVMMSLTVSFFVRKRTKR